MVTRTDYSVRLQKARDLRMQRKFTEAAQAYAEASKLFPSGSAGLFAAICLRDAGRLEEAIEAYSAYSQGHPDDRDGWTGLGVLLKNNRRYTEAIPALKRSLSLRSDPEVRNALISSLWRAGQEGEARDLGAMNLVEKDSNARERFARSEFAHHHLRPGGKGFDPERRTRNVIAFSLWGDRPEYVTGAIVNAQIAQHIYVRWTARFYCDASVPADAIAILKGYGAQIVMMERPEHQRIRPMWRFLASDDPSVNVFVCRDADSRLNAKELLAVHDWLASGKKFHVMRDHVLHHELILAGMWGGMAGVLPPLSTWLEAGSAWFDNRFGDQAFLADMVWPLIRSDVMIHDSAYGFPESKGFPPGYDLPGRIHVGGGTKSMPHWRHYPVPANKEAEGAEALPPMLGTSVPTAS